MTQGNVDKYVEDPYWNKRTYSITNRSERVGANPSGHARFWECLPDARELGASLYEKTQWTFAPLSGMFSFQPGENYPVSMHENLQSVLGNINHEALICFY